MTKREFYRILKENKIFGKFCAELAESNSSTWIDNPRERADDYVSICTSMEIDSYPFKTFISSVLCLWHPYKVKIQP